LGNFVKNLLILYLFPVIFFYPRYSIADTVTLKDGIQGKGTIVKVTSDSLYFIKSGTAQIVPIPRALVRQFEKDTGFIDSLSPDGILSDSAKSTRESRGTLFPCEKLEWNNGAEIVPCKTKLGPDSCTAYTLLYKGCNFEIGETRTISLMCNTDFRENPFPNGKGFRAGGFASAAWGTFFTLLGGLLDNGTSVKVAKEMEYTGLALLGNAVAMLSFGYARKSAYVRWEERHPYKEPVTTDKEE
jgi:hypothetical protein